MSLGTRVRLCLKDLYQQDIVEMTLHNASYIKAGKPNLLISRLEREGDFVTTFFGPDGESSSLQHETTFADLAQTVGRQMVIYPTL